MEAASRLGKTTKSSPPPSLSSSWCWRKLSRTRRFSRLRPTARLSTFVETAKPSRDRSPSLSRLNTRKQRSRVTTGREKTRRNSTGRVSRDARWKDCRPMDKGPGAVSSHDRRSSDTAGVRRWVPMPKQRAAPTRVSGTRSPSGAQALAALRATSVDHRATTLGGHACAEAVTTGPLQATGLKSAFHDCFLSNCIRRRAAQVCAPADVRRRIFRRCLITL